MKIQTLLCALLVALSFVGCAPVNKNPLLTGNVTLDGAPLTEGNIAFADPAGGSYEGVIKDGKFSIQLPAGEKVVRILCNKVVGTVKTEESDSDPVYEQIIPEKYNIKSELKFNVSASGGAANFDLTSDK
ncbi:MAG: hypothetical protein Q4G68_04205 [Planctomycetia bacterium]|nr:hypothetical protein [Planctomycetia bacterium]